MPDTQQQFFDSVMDATRTASARAANKTYRLNIADLRIDLVFLGDALESQLMPALQHLVGDYSSPPIATIHVWDSASCGVRLPPPPCPTENFTDRGDVWGFGGNRFRIAFHWIEYSVNCFDRQTGQGVFWVQQSDALPFWTKASPLRSLLHWCLELHGAQLMHAAAVGNENGAVLITGKGGVGKSSTALSSLVHGLNYAADDYLAVRLEPEPMVYSLYSTAKLNAHDVEIYPGLVPHVTNMASMQGEKAVLHLFPHFRTQIITRMHLRAVLTPSVQKQLGTRIVPADKLRLRRAAAFTTLSQLPYAGQHTQTFIEAMVDRLPGFEILLGTDRRENVSAIEKFLTESDASLQQRAAPAGVRNNMADKPLISVIVPIYNGSKFLPEAIANVLSQDYPSVEIIVVDDGSTEAIEPVIALLPTDVRYFRQENAGPAAARNRGIRDASGGLIAFLDVDDLWPANTLHALAEAMQDRTELAVVHGHAQMLVLNEETAQFDPQGNPAESFPYYIGAGLYRRNAFEQVGLFDATMRFAEDTDWYTRLKESGLPFERVDRVTLNVRRHGANMTAQKTPEELRATSLLAFRRVLQRRRRAAPGGG